MGANRDPQWLLSQIIVYGFSLGFGVMLASLQMVRPASSGFIFEVTWRTWLTFVVVFLAMIPLFHLIVFTQRKMRRRVALAVVAVIAVGSFFYPLRFVPSEKLPAVFGGLALAGLAIAALGGFLLLARRFFESGR